MIIIKTLEEAKQATAGFITTYFPFQKTNSLDSFHAEHSHIINEGKKFGNKTMIGFWYLNDIVNYSLSYPKPEWDKDVCISWADSQNIDVVWAPEYKDEMNILDNKKIKLYKKKVDEIWEDENYNRLFSYGSFPSETIKTTLVQILICDSTWKYMVSTKDGIIRFLQSHFTNKYTNSRMGFIKPIKSPEGLYYSSVYHLYTSKEKEAIAKIEPAIKSFNPLGDVGVLKDDIDVFGKEIDLNIIRLEKFYDKEIIGPHEKLIDIYFSVGKDENIKHDHFAVLIN